MKYNKKENLFSVYLYYSIDTLMNDTLFIEIIHLAIYKDDGCN